MLPEEAVLVLEQHKAPEHEEGEEAEDELGKMRLTLLE